MDLVGEAEPTTTTMYYDPLIDVHHHLPVRAALTTSFYVAPQQAGEARRLFDAACRSARLDKDLDLPLIAGRGIPSSLVLAREWGMTDLEERLASAVEASYEPTWDHDRGEFTWGMGLDEEHPRGQFNAFLAAAEAGGPGRWTALSAAPLERCPQVVDVDFPRVALRRAEWADGTLRLGLVPLHDDPMQRTTFRVTGTEPGSWQIIGPESATVEQTDHGLVIDTPLVTADLELAPSAQRE
ncbi:hypothetical protein [Candidatus Poriferisodalis sp.]|uniref:hypothetical protein n=1 Tax=Candidatus Poriferisodalis sp. TaxID=3101277 RepID=UPI003B5B4257